MRSRRRRSLHVPLIHVGRKPGVHPRRSRRVGPSRDDPGKVLLRLLLLTLLHPLVLTSETLTHPALLLLVHLHRTTLLLMLLLLLLLLLLLSVMLLHLLLKMLLLLLHLRQVHVHALRRSTHPHPARLLAVVHPTSDPRDRVLRERLHSTEHGRVIHHPLSHLRLDPGLTPVSPLLLTTESGRSKGSLTLLLTHPTEVRHALPWLTLSLSLSLSLRLNLPVRR